MHSISHRLLLLVVTALAVAACSGDPAPQTPPPTAVNVATVQPTALPLELTYTARTTGVREVEVRARVSGILLQRQYQEGSRVKAGDVLFRIDPAPTRAAAAQTRAQLAVAQAQLSESKRDSERVAPLYEKGAVSQRDRDAALASYESARASVAAAQAALDAANLDLSYTEVRAPISGVTSREARSEGSLVTAGSDSSLLTRIVQTDRLYVEFSVPENEAVLIRGALEKRTGATPGMDVDVVYDEATGASKPAKLTFIDTAADLNSGTIQARAELDNRDGQLIPGQFVRATVRGVELAPMAVIPVRAVMRGPQGSFVWALDEQNIVAFRPVKTGRAQGNLVTITEGLASGDRYIVDGVVKVQPGAPVEPNAITVEQAIGPRDASAAPAGKASAG